MNTPTPQPGFAPAPVNSSQWNSQWIQAAADARMQNTQDRTAAGTAGVADWLLHPIEWAGSKIHAVYSTIISRPLATPFLAFYGAAAEAEDTGDEWARIFSGDTWDKAYQQAKHVSPGQALGFGIIHFGEGREEFRKSMGKEVIKTVETEPGKFETVNLNKTGIIWDSPEAVKGYYDHGVQKYISGGLDFAASWYLDPLVLGGKTVGLARRAAYVRPAFAGVESKNLAQKITGTGGKKNLIDNNLKSSAFGEMSNLIVANKAKLGDQFTEWVTHQAWAKNSRDSGSMAAALTAAKDQDEVNHILAISMGDKGALKALQAKNAVLGAQMEMLEAQHKGLVTNFPSNPTPFQAGLQQFQLQGVSDAISKISAQQQHVERMLNLEDSMFNGMYFMPGLSKIASNFGQHARGLQTTNSMKLAKAGGLRTAAMSLAYNNLYVRPVRVLTGTTFNGVRAPGHINIDAEDSYRAFDASLGQAKVWTQQERAVRVGAYINADSAGRNAVLQAADMETFKRIADKHGMNPDDAQALYRTLGGMKGRARDGQVYSTANITTPNGGVLRADHVDDAGNLIVVRPVFNTQLENTHIMTDYEHLDRVLSMTAAPFKKLFNEAAIRSKHKAGTKANANEAMEVALKGVGKTAGAKALATREVGADMLEVMNKMWKFNVLLRMGYGPRAIADDFMGQAARFGSASLFLERAARGGRNLANRTMNRMMHDVTGYQQQLASVDMGIENLTKMVAQHEENLARVKSLPAPTKSAKAARQRQQQLANVQQAYDDSISQIESLKSYRNKLNETKGSLGDNYVIMDDGTAFARPFEGTAGQMFRDLNSGRRTLDSMMGGTASDMWNAYRSGDWRAITRADETFNESWMRVVQNQIAHDDAAVAYLNGQDLERWFRTPAGRAYRNASGIRSLSPAEHADRIATSVDHYLPMNSAETAALRDAVRGQREDNEILDLMRSVRNEHAPVSVQAAGLEYAMGKGKFFQAVDKTVDGFYKIMNQLPSETLSRNPLFFQLYRQHASEMWQARKDAGLAKLTPREQQAVADRAREMALKDVKKFTFNMDFESKLAYKMRFIAPFFGPMEESFRRWGRIVADRPETIGRAAQVYTSPIHAGHAVDLDGNPVDGDGYATRPDGTRYLVPKNKMHLQFQAPTWVAKQIGMDQGSVIDVPINTLNLVLQNDPWYNPGTGPWVQLPANWAAIHTGPQDIGGKEILLGDVFQQLGVLQKVTPNSSDQILGSLPKFLSTVLGGQDYEQQQKDMAYLMQSESYKWNTGLRDTEPTWQEIKNRVGHMAYLRGLMKVGLPFSADFKDPYQFFRNQYQQLQQADPNTADQVFLARYGDAAFAFTGALTSNKKKLPATVNAVRADEKFAYLTDMDPDYAQLIVGPYASGDFSQTAYIQQMASGDRKVNDARDVVAKSQANLGWAQFDKDMNNIRAELYQAGFTSFQDKGAENIDAMRKGLIMMMTTETLPSGKKNPFYNEEFTKDFMTTDRSKDQRRAEMFNKLVTEKALIGDDMRDDIKGLALYMDARNALTTQLDERYKAGGSKDINAKHNLDLKLGFHGYTEQLIEANTLFQSLHDRWLMRDMYDHGDPGLDIMMEKQ
jgi:hypothetical protein